ncbi:hypothetical protein B0H12DRAFT_1239769 [Mycena haematopus]|nr:hypothetical protein B0H12DRAFT_1239769 [Mycena haematopus]
MSTPPSQHFREFSQLPSDPVGADVFFLNPGAFVFNSMPPYRLDASDIHWHASRPFFPVLQEERAVGDYQMSEEERNSLYFLRHPSDYPRLAVPSPPSPFSTNLARLCCGPSRPRCPCFPYFFPRLPSPASHTAAGGPQGWRSIYMGHPFEHWAERERMPPFFRFPWTTEFSASHPLVPFQLSELNHNSLLNIRSPALECLLEILASPPRLLSSAEQDRTAQVLNHGIPCLLQLARELRERRVSPDFAHGVFNSTRSLIQGFPEGRRNRAWTLALPAYNEDFSQSVFPRDFIFPNGPHDHQNRTPFPLWNSDAAGTPDPLLDCWDQYQLARPSPASPPPRSSADPISPPAPSPGTMETSALLRDDTLTDDQKLATLRSRVASRTPGPSADAGGESTLPSQTLEESTKTCYASAEDTPPATQAPLRPSTLLLLSSYGLENAEQPPQTKPPRYILPGVTVPRTGPKCGGGAQEAPTPPSRRSTSRQATPTRVPSPRSASAEIARLPMASPRRTTTPTSMSHLRRAPPSARSGKKSAAPSSQDDEPRFPPTSRRAWSSSRHPRITRFPEPFNTPALQRILRYEATEPTLFDVGCATACCATANAPTFTGDSCPQCHTGKLARAATSSRLGASPRINFLEQYTRLSDAQGNRLVTAAMNAREPTTWLAHSSPRQHSSCAAKRLLAGLPRDSQFGPPASRRRRNSRGLRDDWDDMVDWGGKGWRRSMSSTSTPSQSLSHTSDVRLPRKSRRAPEQRHPSSATPLNVAPKRAALARPPLGSSDEEFLRAHSSAAGPSHLDFVGTASVFRECDRGPSRSRLRAANIAASHQPSNCFKSRIVSKRRGSEGKGGRNGLGRAA